MCIRDRLKVHARTGEADKQQATADRIELHQVALGQHDRTCLLYTSDAADERSSVDLGGRRIITKKTTADPVGP